jgi:hypothetical protein
MKRRKFINYLSLASLSGVVSTKLALAQEKKTTGEPELTDGKVEYLFVQTAHKCALSGGKLTLTGIGPTTLYFSDRPERIVGHAPTDKFPILWNPGEDNFSKDPPNTALSVFDDKEPVEIVVVLKSPKLDGNNLVYDVDVLEGKKEYSGGACSLFIDVIGRPLTPLSIAGVHRRHRRRRRHHRRF